MKPIFTVCLLAVSCSCLSTSQEGVPPAPGGFSEKPAAAAAPASSEAPVDAQHGRYAHPPSSSARVEEPPSPSIGVDGGPGRAPRPEVRREP